VQAFSCLLKVLRTMFIHITSPKGQGRLPTDRVLGNAKPSVSEELRYFRLTS